MADPLTASEETGGRSHPSRRAADPDHPRLLWTWASYLVEAPTGGIYPEIEQLRAGVPLLAAGQLSYRWMIENGHATRCGVIVATTVKPGALENHLGLHR